MDVVPWTYSFFIRYTGLFHTYLIAKRGHRLKICFGGRGDEISNYTYVYVRWEGILRFRIWDTRACGKTAVDENSMSDVYSLPTLRGGGSTYLWGGEEWAVDLRRRGV